MDEPEFWEGKSMLFLRVAEALTETGPLDSDASDRLRRVSDILYAGVSWLKGRGAISPVDGSKAWSLLDQFSRRHGAGLQRQVWCFERIEKITATLNSLLANQPPDPKDTADAATFCSEMWQFIFALENTQ